MTTNPPSLAPTPAQLQASGRLAQGHPSKAGLADLDERILAVEQRLILREENLHRRLRALTERVERATQPRKLAVPILGAVLAGVSAWWMVRRFLPPPPADSSGPGPAACEAEPETSWVRMIGLGWPLLPQSWRSRVDPTVASLAMGVGLPLADRLWRRLRRRRRAVQARRRQRDDGLARSEATGQPTTQPTIQPIPTD